MIKGVAEKNDKSKPIWFDGPPKPTRELSPPRKASIKDTKDAIASAVNSVNKVLGSHVKRDVLVDESLDSLDYFKVTSLGRMQNKE